MRAANSTNMQFKINGWSDFQCGIGSADEPVSFPLSDCCQRHCKDLTLDDFISGACECDKITRKNVKSNPACQLALAWYESGNGKGTKNMVILPYKDRLELFSKYLQQLVMESLGKELDLNGKIVNQGITVLGNKGSTDQHSYIQQLRDGLNDFLSPFIEV
jgi:glucose-6-phosphate isomerase